MEDRAGISKRRLEQGISNPSAVAASCKGEVAWCCLYAICLPD
jgi:hypothetical protein